MTPLSPIVSLFGGDLVDAADALALGALVRLAERSWHRDPPCSLPDIARAIEAGVVMNWARLTQADWIRVEPLVLLYWCDVLSGRAGVRTLRSPRLYAAWQDERARFDRRSRAGTNANLARWANAPPPNRIRIGSASEATPVFAAAAGAPRPDRAVRGGVGGDSAPKVNSTTTTAVVVVEVRDLLIQAGVRSPRVIAELCALDPALVRFALAEVAGAKPQHRPGQLVQMIRSGLAVELMESRRRADEQIRASSVRTIRDFTQEQRRAQDERARLVDTGRRVLSRLSAEALELRVNAYCEDCPSGALRRRRGESLAANQNFLAWLGSAEDRGGDA